MGDNMSGKFNKAALTKWKVIFGKREFTMFFVLLGMILVSAVISPSFRSINNFLNILNQNAIYGLMAIGMKKGEIVHEFNNEGNLSKADILSKMVN